MAHFSESLCEEVIKSEGKCGLTRNEMVQMARFALRAIRAENPLIPDAIRYRWLRQERLSEMLVLFPTTDTSDVGLDYAIDVTMSGRGPEASSSGDPQ